MSHHPFFQWGNRPPTGRRTRTVEQARAGIARGLCRPGRRIRTMAHLLRVIDTEPSLWVRYARKPLPVAVIRSWPLHFVINQVAADVFSLVVRPAKAAP